MDLLDAPCVFCGYNGPGYYQAGTHEKHCPWWVVGGEEKRKGQLRELMGMMFMAAMGEDTIEEGADRVRQVEHNTGQDIESELVAARLALATARKALKYAIDTIENGQGFMREGEWIEGQTAKIRIGATLAATADPGKLAEVRDARITELLTALVKAAIPLEVLASSGNALAFRELSPELQKVIPIALEAIHVALGGKGEG